ncbi:MAG TPA: ABC transporter ATP-binding protein, partial [Firmicutes bacterium]|nr:ABC transporter ATP-binding protein [Bacillota bacterium]
SGKTTTLRAISGLIRPRSGSIRLADADISQTPAHEIVNRGIAHVPEGRRVFSTLTVEENLRLGAYRHRGHPEKVSSNMGRVYKLFPRLEERRQQLAGTLSGGEQQ